MDDENVELIVSEVTVEANNATVEINSPKGLGGWLILPIIGLFISTFQSCGQEYSFLDVLNNWSAFSPIKGLQGTLAFEVIASTLLLVLMIFTLVVCFLKKKIFVKAIITLYVLNFLELFIDMLLMKAFASNLVDTSNTNYHLAGTIPKLAIWIPYFITSKRVKNTFVN